MIPKNGVQNLSGNLPMNLSQEHDWIPDVDQLATKLKMAGYGNSLDSIFGLPSFEIELSAFNSHFDSQVDYLTVKSFISSQRGS